jgi:flagellar protein FlbT
MSLALTLKSQERMILGNAVVRNTGRHSAHLLIETAVPILRRRDILPEKEANTPCGRIYMALQLIYVDEAKRDEYMNLFLRLTREVLEAAPSMASVLEKVSVSVTAGDYYKALQQAKRLLQYEQCVLERATAHAK